MKKVTEKPLYWIGSSLEDLKKFPEGVKDVMGYSLDVAQRGVKADNAKPLANVVKGGRIFEVYDDHKGDTYRAVYTVKFEKAVYVLHAFKKKSKSGIATPKPDIDTMRARYKKAEEHYAKNFGGKK
ncbi:MAG: type II toxin-antitoxin system RelE/ParE family toxin [Gammaproteobacteria bacterium]|nr:type II toxin-antitoxin system RelE/ParE family toxin [Gammaproteobacteria bacterium]MDH5729261.1 type II toxin-antitoxin system RelE/ParE family toxin [Gammaproteobacteria bacterium]